MNIFAITYWCEKDGKSSFGFCKASWDGTYIGLQRIAAELWKHLNTEQPPVIVSTIPVKDLVLDTQPVEAEEKKD